MTESPTASPLVQDGYAIRLDWGGAGVDALGPHCAVLVVVDVLSFSTSIDIAVGRGAGVRLMPWQHDRGHGTTRPSTLVEVSAGDLLELASPNGGSLCARAAGHARVFAACLRNARAVAEAASAVARDAPIGVIAAGEQWGINLLTSTRGDAGPLRPAIEDQLGAGAVVSELLKVGHGQASPEAALAATTYRAAEPYLGDLLVGCASGQELATAGFGQDVTLAAEIGVSGAAPVLVNGVFQDAFEDGRG